MSARRLLDSAATLAATLTLAALVLTAPSGPAGARVAGEGCVSGAAPVPLAAAPRVLADAARSGCPVSGRVVTDGRLALVVPPAGTTVSGDGVGRSGEVRGVTVTNTGAGVRIVREPRHLGDDVSQRRTSPPACQDRTFHLEHHRWARGLRYQINLGAMPRRFHRKTVVAQVKAANANMRKGRNTCGRARITAPASHYLGRTSRRPNIGASGPTCKSPDGSNVVGFGNLPQGLLGWTCYWWGGNGRMIEADMVIDNGKYLATTLPSSCVNRWDFEGTVTHEWGHAYGMAHTGDGHANLTMQHLLTPCSTYARTLGLGDWLGMNKMYGHHR
jgi:hypothetical protein